VLPLDDEPHAVSASSAHTQTTRIRSS
jgi:hypothetical protein